MKKKYNPQLIQEDLRKLIQQTLREALEAELEEFQGSSFRPEGSRFRKATDGKKVFPNDQSVFKSLYLAAQELEKKWNKSAIRDWGIIYGQLSVIFGERLGV